MYRLLVVDDEEIITDGLAEILNDLGIPDLDIYKAYSGSEALEWLDNTRIDIVLSDIRMPEIGGLELMEIICRNWPRCRIIFLTGYNDFESVYKAIQVWGVRYLLKTEGNAKVIAEVRDVIRELEGELRTDHFLQQASEQRNTLETLAQGDYFRHVLFGTEEGMSTARTEDFQKLNISLDPQRPILVVLGSLIRTKILPSFAKRQEAALAVKFLGDSYLREKTRCVGLIDRYGDLLWLIQPEDDRSLTESFEAYERVVRFLEGTLEHIQEVCFASLQLESAFTVCRTIVEWETLPDAYDRIRQLQYNRAGDGANMIMTVQIEENHSTGQMKERGRSEKFEQLAGHLEGGRRDAFMELLQELLKPIINERLADGAQAMEFYYSLALVLLSYVNRRQLNEQVPTAGLMRFDAHFSWQEGFEYLSRTAELLFSLRRNVESTRAAEAMEAVCSHIEKHIGEELSLVRLAKYVHFNPSYLSRLFKQEKGLNVSEYIEVVRIKKAKELLATEEMKIQEIGNRVGYDSPQSFTRFFKKATGMSPQEYRDFARGTV